jgi:hypothetical protein
MAMSDEFEPWVEGPLGVGKSSVLTGPEAVRCIRAICAEELDRPYDYPFFQADYLPGEEPDMALVRLFMAERAHHGSDFHTVLILCHG